jgi:2-polyprenyl-6-methoxyphenol hydroxylase-like FAD-dependent oxidoreductase
MERAYERVKPFIDAGDGKDGKGEFTITRAEPYVQRQRVAATGRKGRVLLAGDALHSNNPFGGLGLTSGICDAFGYGNALVCVINDREDDGVLTHCSESRRWTWINATNVMSVANLKRLQSFKPEDIKKRNEFFQKLNTDNNFPGQVRKGMNGLMIDSFEKKAPVQPKYREDLLNLAYEDVVKLFPKSISAS